MRRAPVVIGATVMGLIGVLAFHTKSAPVNLGSLSGASATQGSTTTTTAGSSAGSNSSGASSPPKSGSSTSLQLPLRTNTAASSPSATRSATGAAVDYHYGILSVSVTASGKRITKVGIALPKRRWELPLPVHRPAVDPDPRAAGHPGSECQHPRCLRCKLHERRI